MNSPVANVPERTFGELLDILILSINAQQRQKDTFVHIFSRELLHLHMQQSGYTAYTINVNAHLPLIVYAELTSARHPCTSMDDFLATAKSVDLSVTA